MHDFTVTLIHRAIVCGSITVEAENFDAARSAALSRADEASWPVDETGSVVRPSDQQAAVVADYARNDTTREEVYFDEALPPSTAPPAPSDAPALEPLTGPHHGPSLADQLRLVGALAGTTDPRGIEERRHTQAYCEQVTAEMLAALKEARLWLDGMVDHGDMHPEDRDNLAKYDAIIARAEGRA